MGILQAVTIGLIGLILTPGYFFYFDVTPKVLVLLAGTAAVLLRSARQTGRAPRMFSILIGAQMLSLGISTAFSTHPAFSLFGTDWRRFGAVVEAALLLFTWSVARYAAGRVERIRTILRVVAAAGAIGAAYGIAQYFGFDPVLPAAAYHVGEGIWTIVRPPGTLGYVSYFATWLLFIAFFSLALADLEIERLPRAMAYSVAALAILAMLLTGTRAAMAGLVAGALVWLYWRGFRISRRVVAAGAALLLAGVVFYLSPSGQQLRSRTRWFVEDPWGGARPQLWKDSLAMAGHSLALGYGPEVFAAEFPRFESKRLAAAYPDFSHESPHNIFLDALLSQGVAGLVILCGFCWMGFAGAWRLRKPFAAGVAGALAAGIVAQQFTVFTMPTALMFFVAIALAQEPAPPEKARRARSLLAAAAAVLLLYCTLRLGVADHEMALAQRSLKAHDLAGAAAHYDRYVSWRLPGGTADLWYSRAGQSGPAALRATTTAEDPFNAWYSLATMYGWQNDAPRTEAALRSAVASSPNWYKPHWTLARVLSAEHRWDDAEREAELAVELNGGKHPEVTETLAEIRSLRASRSRQP